MKIFSSCADVSRHIFHLFSAGSLYILLYILVGMFSLCGCTGSWQSKLEKGLYQMERGDLAEAVSLFGEVAEHRHPEGWLYRGDAYVVLAETANIKSSAE